MKRKSVAYACNHCYVVFHLHEADLARGAPACDYCGRRLEPVGEESG